MIRYPAPLVCLPLRADAPRLQHEASGVPRHRWVPDRLSTDPAAYMTVALVSHRGRENDRMFGPFEPTPLLAACPYVRQLLAWFEAPICEVRLRWLGPGASGAFHFDQHMLLADRIRLHVPIQTTPHALFHCADRVVHMPAGSVWTFDRMRRHAVFNDDPTIGRLHLIMDFVASPKLAELVAEAARAPELVAFDARAKPRLAFEARRPPAVSSPREIGSALTEVRRRLPDDAPFRAMAGATKTFLAGWSRAWKAHGARRSGWRIYRKLARDYHRRWRARFPPRHPADDASETSWIGCLLETCAYEPARAPRTPSLSGREVLRLVDTLYVALGRGGKAQLSVDGARFRPIPPEALTALVAIARGAAPEELDRAAFDAALPTLRWLAEEEALTADEHEDRLDLHGDTSQRASGDVAFPLPRTTRARLRALRARVAGARFRATGTLHFLLGPGGKIAARVPDVDAYARIFPDGVAIAQQMAMGRSVPEIAEAAGYDLDDAFVDFIAWLWDLLPLGFEGDEPLRRPTFAHRLAAGETIACMTLAERYSADAFRWLAEAGVGPVILDGAAHSIASLRLALARARVVHVDALVKTSPRIGVADLRDVPASGLVVSDCDDHALAELERAFGGREVRPFVLAVVETMAGLASAEAIARSPHVDALVVGDGDLARAARLQGVDPRKTLARAHDRTRRLALRHGKTLAAVVHDDADEKRARAAGASIIVRGTDETIFAATGR